MIRKKYFIITLIISLTLIIGGTFAWLSWQSVENTNFTLNIGEVAEVFFTGGNEIKASGIGPVISEEEGEITEFQILKKIDDPIILKISFNPSILPEGLKEESFKYKLYSKTNEKESYTLITEGNFKDKIQGTEFTLIDELEVSSNSNYYRFIIYIDGNMLNPTTMKDQTFEGTILITSKSKGVPVPLTTFISDKYNNAPKTQVVNNNITYNYATTESLMEDIDGNIRYYGPTPNNYIYFNCEDYNNQTASTCEIWRIIGVFGDKVEIMRNDSLGELAWDQDKNDDTSKTSNDSNWTTATLQKLLNTKYYAGTETVTYYSDLTGTTTKSLNFTTLGLKNDQTRSKIAEVTWNLGANSSTSVFSDQIYTSERGTNVFAGRPTTWKGNIGLMYPSDYGYATDFTKCVNKTLYDYTDTTCKDNDWIFKMMSGGDAWTLISHSGFSNGAWDVRLSGSFYFDGVYNGFGVHPVLFLNSDQVIKAGVETGTKNDCYKLESSSAAPPLTSSTVASTISNKYNEANKTTVINNSIVYNYASTELLMQDQDKNIRYYGTDPNNYLYFNCQDYLNQSSSTCELWRIIGVFDDKVKIIKNDSLGALAWDQDKNDVISKTSYDNDWTTSSLQKLLNTKYYAGTETVTYYSGPSGMTTTSLNFMNMGLKNEATRNKIAEVTWNLGGWSNPAVYSNQIYEYERGTNVSFGRPTTWIGKIGLMYPSDYGYAADFAKCTYALNNYSNSSCKDNDWLFNSSVQWVLTPDYNNNYGVWYSSSIGYIANNYSDTYYDNGVRPVLYLTSDQTIKMGSGESINPYQINA